jgi:hypothetical protein
MSEPQKRTSWRLDRVFYVVTGCRRFCGGTGDIAEALWMARTFAPAKIEARCL